MPTKAKVVINNPAFEELIHSSKVVEDIRARTTAVEQACSAQSGWGGYASSVSTVGNRPHGRVYSIGRHDDEARHNRMIRNLDAAR